MDSPGRSRQTASKSCRGPLHSIIVGPPTLQSPPTSDATATTTKSLKPRRKVQFLEARIVGTVTPHSYLSEEERNQIWYQQQELDEFKSEARKLCRDLRDQTTILDTNPPGDDVSSRGLEHRVCIKRQRNKALAVTFIIKAQLRNRDPEFIALVAGKCSVWAKEVAAAEASRDFCAVYLPHLLPCLPKTENIDEYPFPVKKRSPSDSGIDRQDDCNSRKVKIRRTSD